MADEELKQEEQTETTNVQQENEETTAQNQSEQNQDSENDATENDCAQTESEEVSSKEETKELTDAEKIEKLTKENEELKDQLLRRAADFDNYRKRMIKEKQDTFDYANANLLSDLLESLDNFDRALEAGSSATDVKSMVDGIKIVNDSLVKMLESKYGLTCYGVAGDEFNPDIHEAIGRVEEEVEKETLKQVYLKGYKLKERVIRNAKVMVSVPKN